MLVKPFRTRVGAVVVAAAFVLAPSVGRAADAGRVLDAVKAGDAAAVRSLVHDRADANASSPDGTSALHWAAHRGDVEAVRFLIAQGATAGAANRYGVTPLRLACEQGTVAVVEALLGAGADPNAARPQSGETPMMVAARAGQPNVVRALVAHGAGVDAVEPIRSQTALMWAAAERHPEVVDVLLDSGANPRLLSKTGISALMFAIRAGDLESTRLLLEKGGADVNAPAKDGTSMLVLAILNARFDVAKLLLEQGADSNVQDPHGTPLQVLAFLRRATDFVFSQSLPRQLPHEGVDSFALTRELLARGADINARYQGQKPPKHVAIASYMVPFVGATPFYIASITADVPYMRFLAANGADPTLPTAANVTPLLAASGVGTLFGATQTTNGEAFAAVRLAAELGNDPRARVAPGRVRGVSAAWDGATALHGAATIGSNDMVQWLADRGVPLDAKSKAGANAYQVAAGINGAVFKAWPDTAELILKLAREHGVTMDTLPLARAGEQ